MIILIGRIYLLTYFCVTTIEDPESNKQADYIVAKEIQNYLEKNQTVGELSGLAVSGFLKSFLGAAIETVGTAYGLVNATTQLIGSAINPAWGNDRTESGITDFSICIKYNLG